MAEVLGRYSKLSATGLRVAKARNLAEKHRRGEAWAAPVITGPSRTRHILAGREAEVRADYRAGMGCVVLAKKYGLPVSTMLGWLHREGVEIRSDGKLTLQDLAEIQQLRHEGWTLQAIGDRFGVTRFAVAARLRQLTAVSDALPQ